MGESFGSDARVGWLDAKTVGNLLQFIALLAAIVGFAMHMESRLAAMEQKSLDEDYVRGQILQRMDSIETRLNQVIAASRAR